MALLEHVKSAFQLKSSATDDALLGLIRTALADMRRVGVRDELLDCALRDETGDGAEPTPVTAHPMVAQAVVAYCKAYYYVDSVASPFWLQCYRMTVTNLMNSDLSEWLNEAV